MNRLLKILLAYCIAFALFFVIGIVQKMDEIDNEEIEKILATDTATTNDDEISK